MYAREDPTRTRGGTSSRPLPRQNDNAASSGATSILNLQRLAGNAAVSRSLSGPNTNAPLTIQRAGGYDDGTYRGRNRERRRLEDEWDSVIDGNSTHQAEHPILYSAAAPRARTRVPRGQAGAVGAHARAVENDLPAYYEGYDDHRAHDGTGTRRRDRIGTTGMTQRQYRDAQTEALEVHNNPANAMHMNMMGYAHQPGFRNAPRTAAVEQSDDSYSHMLRSGRGSAPYFDSNGQVRRTRPLMNYERAELDAGRRVARTGRYPDEHEQDAMMRSHGARSYRLRSGRTNDFDSLSSYPDLGSDRSASPHELDTSYRQRDRSRRRSRSRGRMNQREQLNLLARGGTLDGADFATSFDGGGYDDERTGRSRQRSQSRRRMASRSRTRASSIAPDISEAYSYGGHDDGYDDERTGRSRQRSQSRRRMASRSRTRASSIAPDISEAYSYGGHDDGYDDERTGRSRSRSRRNQSRRRMASQSRHRSSSMYPDVSDGYSYGGGAY
ncbi:hypothetical protein ACFW9L_23175 [Streptomyces sp. NPDC059517]|uniref:hypothetical protein n=1 Tax=Streptomyces sp. NPDC059517 TaxID=3346855 RepID=UPI0036C0D6CC